MEDNLIQDRCPLLGIDGTYGETQVVGQVSADAVQLPVDPDLLQRTITGEASVVDLRRFGRIKEQEIFFIPSGAIFSSGASRAAGVSAFGDGLGSNCDRAGRIDRINSRSPLALTPVVCGLKQGNRLLIYLNLKEMVRRVRRCCDRGGPRLQV
jgi:hypothetical protein